MEENLTIVEVAGADERKDSFDFFGRQMAQKVAFRQQLDRLLRILLLASQSIFAKSCRVAYRCPLLVEEQRGEIIDDGTESEAAGNEPPCRIGVETLLMQFLGTFERQFDGQRTDEGAGGKGQNEASIRLESGTYRPRAAPKIDEDVVRSPSSETITISREPIISGLLYQHCGAG